MDNLSNLKPQYLSKSQIAKISSQVGKFMAEKEKERKDKQEIKKQEKENLANKKKLNKYFSNKKNLDAKKYLIEDVLFNDAEIIDDNPIDYDDDFSIAYHFDRKYYDDIKKICNDFNNIIKSI